MEEWKTYKLGELLNIKYGKDHKSLSDGLFPAYGSGGIMRMVEKPIYDKPSILIPRKGSLNNIIYTDSPFWTVDTMFWTIIDKDIVLPHYLYYSIKDIDFASLNVGSAVPSLTCPIIEAIEVTIPSISIQQKILNCIEPIDEKISLNNRINHNLEQQAQALYKSWFVDFEPFRGEKFVDSELGLIPEGWRVGQLSEICEIVGGGTPSKVKTEYYTNNGIHWLTPKDLSISCKKFTSRGLDDITELGYKSSSAKLMPKGAVLFSSRAPIGYLTIAKNTICTNQGFKSAVPGIAGTAFLYYYLKFNTEYIKTLASGSTFKEASGSLMKSLAVVIPPKMVFDKFEDVMARYFDSQENIELENSHHVEVRDSLLPRLMSGKLKINDLTC